MCSVQARCHLQLPRWVLSCTALYGAVRYHSRVRACDSRRDRNEIKYRVRCFLLTVTYRWHRTTGTTRPSHARPPYAAKKSRPAMRAKHTHDHTSRGRAASRPVRNSYSKSRRYNTILDFWKSAYVSDFGYPIACHVIMSRPSVKRHNAKGPAGGRRRLLKREEQRAC